MPIILKKYYPVRKIIFFLGEGSLILSILLIIDLFFSGWKIFLLEFPIDLVKAGSVTFIFQLCLYFFDLYDLRKPESTSDTAIRMIQSFGVGCIVLGLLYYLAPFLIISTKIFWCSYIVICICLVAWRTLYYYVLEKKLFAKKIVIIGTGDTAEKICNELFSNKDSGFNVAAFIGSHKPKFDSHHIPLLPAIDSLFYTTAFPEIERIIIALDNRRGTMPVEELLKAKSLGVFIEDGMSFYETLTGKILVEKVNPAWLIFSEGFDYGRLTYLIKRLTDIFFSSLGLIISFPISLITAVLIKIESPGSVFYMQERVCEKGHTFKIIKFRSMRNDAEKDGAVWAQQNDTRVTRVGNFIRKVRIDEIPQMWNVFIGEMSFVGPRPERPIFVDKLTKNIPYYSLRHSIKPGITG